MRMRVLVVEDEILIQNHLKKNLERYGYAVDCAGTYAEATTLFSLAVYDLALLDLYLPDGYGEHLVESFARTRPECLLCVISAEDTIEKKEELLQWCDEYVTKPYHIYELLARMRMLERRKLRAPYPETHALACAGIILNTYTRTIEVHGASIDLRAKEFSLLAYLMRHKDTIVSREELIEHIWDNTLDPLSNSLDVHIQHIRSKIGCTPRNRIIETVPKCGYRMQSIPRAYVVNTT